VEVSCLEPSIVEERSVEVSLLAALVSLTKRFSTLCLLHLSSPTILPGVRRGGEGARRWGRGGGEREYDRWVSE